MKNEATENNYEFLFKAVLALETMEECAAFFDDLCTMQELNAMSQRIIVAKLLKSKCVYSDIVKSTGASTATISRVNRSLRFGSNGYDKVFGRIEDK